jgi:hypothetical protein
VTDEPGYTAEEIERGEDRAWHIPKWGCLGFVVFVAVVALTIWWGLTHAPDF